MSILDIDTPTKITREYLAENGWHPDRLERNWWIRKSTRSNGTASYCYFVYTFRDPHKRIRNQLKCNSWFDTDVVYTDIKEITDLNATMSGFINQTSILFHGK